MEFFKNFFNDDKQVVGLCAFKKREQENFSFKFEPKINPKSFLYQTNTSKNFFVL